jgi:hypothetical protein
MLNKIRIVVILGALVVAAGFFAYTRFFGNGTLHVLAVGTTGVELVVDGKPVQPTSTRGDHFRYSVPQGSHQVKVTDKSTGKDVSYTVAVQSGFNDFLLPVRGDQCFARFDMTTAAYSKAGGEMDVPPVKERYKNAGAAIELPSSTYFSFEEMPNKRRKRESVYLLRDLPCAFVDSDETVAFALSSKVDQLFESKGEVVIGDKAEELNDVAPEKSANETP